ncbi:S-adenosyl-L-methionine-dependent methyltransferase [Phycomyces nitens]|nr:S-adenosyl-L-methionine-dependent methyltransferase [Phycomyces nitens]
MGAKLSTYRRRSHNAHSHSSQTSNESLSPIHSTDSSIVRQGRHFHNMVTSTYWLPNDEEEMDRLVGQHFALKSLFNGNFLEDPKIKALFEKGSEILDVGCGPGTWIMDVATDYPACQCTGIDMSEVFPNIIRPSNVSFHSGNVLERMPFEDNTFDFVNMRLFILALRKEEWHKVLKEIFRVLKPGGYIQSTECSMLDVGNEFVLHVGKAIIEEMVDRGQEPGILYVFPELMENANFQEVTQDKRIAHLSQPDHINREFLWDMINIFKSAQPFLSKKLGIPEENYPGFLQQAYKECQKSPGAEWVLGITVGQKPGGA